MELFDVLILAGGQGQRMGGQDKGLVQFRNLPMVDHTVRVVRPFCAKVIISCNRNPEAYSKSGDVTVADSLEGFQGPLAGILSGLELCETRQMLVLPCDTPMLEPDLIRRLVEFARQEPDAISLLSDGENLEPLHSVIPASLAGDLRVWLEGGQRAVRRWMGNHPMRTLDVSEYSAQLHNLNTPDELNHFQ